MNRYRIAIAVAGMLLMPIGAHAQRGRGAGRMGPPVRPAPMPRADTAQRGRPPHGTPAQANPNPALAGRLQPLLPPGMPLDTAAAGFKNRGQFIAALHVSRNLGIPFVDLKDRMTGPQRQSLGSAIQSLRPAMARDDVRKAERLAQSQASEDQRSGEQTAR